MRLSVRLAIVLTGTVLLVMPWPAYLASASDIDEVVVTGERTGPGLWWVHRSAQQLWILGTVAPLPKDITWNSRQVEGVIEGAQQVLIAKPLNVGVTHALWLLLTQRNLFMVRDGKRLHDVLAHDLYARFAVLRTKYAHSADKWERYRPILASAFLQEAAFRSIGLSSRLDLGAEVRALARKHRVRIEEISIAGVRDALEVLRALAPSAENICVEAALKTVESGLPRLSQRARAWARGDLEAIQHLPQTAEVDACLAALSTHSGVLESLMAQMHRTWLVSIEGALQHGNSLVVVNMDQLLERGGLLDELRTRGYEIEAPQ